MYHEIAWQISIAGMAALLAVFVFVALRSGTEAEYQALTKRAYRVRAMFFWALLLLVTPVMLYSMSDLPYDAQGDAPRPRGATQVIEVVGHQWHWRLSHDQVAPGQPVEFRVSSADVNHGLGIYDRDMKLVAQTMAMPGYVNRLRHTFEREGVYKLLCMEYCGLAHHAMFAEIRVAAADKQPGNTP